ncbi:LPXTG cell wall anchor domain-containing protein [Ureibacillus acetophenoni]|uniref:LPXTG-motif cell wall-anchored protein n=1 Tax=Ureibacillus acetophenoni TaxID=614649 RepID=A0A285U3X8_9BACL|nr:LPXTG cell wall anchor domain-containing protein [Ureibacillus acetophenoni]SOC36654.1 LPXTG-motif cell wall-anchored protein [Ureibacillus acetophenoni]
MDITLAIIILVAVMYLLIIIGGIFFLRKRKKGMFTQTVDPKPVQNKYDLKKDDK